MPIQEQPRSNFQLPDQWKATGNRFTVLKGSIRSEEDMVTFDAFDDETGQTKEYKAPRVMINRGHLTRVMSVENVELFCNNQMLDGNYEVKEGKV